MKATELMIGDWVLDGKKPAQMTGIFCDDLFETTLSPSVGGDCLNPIPLTPEILEKNGFKFYCTDVFEEWKSKDKRITIHDEEYPNSFNKWAVHVDTEDMRTMGYFEITYVHELQHFLRHLKIDNEIEI